MIIFLLLVITFLLLLIYRHLTKKDREEAKLKKYLAKLEREQQDRYKSTQSSEHSKNTEMPEEDLDAQIKKYDKVRKSWK